MGPPCLNTFGNGFALALPCPIRDGLGGVVRFSAIARAGPPG
jgi:hypothetical protein